MLCEEEDHMNNGRLHATDSFIHALFAELNHPCVHSFVCLSVHQSDHLSNHSASWQLCVAARQGQSGSQDYRVLSAGQDDTVRVWDPFEMVCLRVLRETRSELTALTFFAAGNSPLTGRRSATAAPQCVGQQGRLHLAVM